MKWIHGREALEAVLETVNSFHSTIRFTAEVSNEKHVFLDGVAVDLYTKPTFFRQYLLPTSCHTLIAAKIFLSVLYYASDTSALTMRLLRKEWKISLNNPTSGAIKSRSLIKPQRMLGIWTYKTSCRTSPNRTKLFCHQS